MESSPKKLTAPSIPTSVILLWGTALAVIGYIYWPPLRDMHDRWANDPRYSHGYLVPLFSLFLLWYRKNLVRVDKFRTSWWGLVPIIFGGLLKLVGGILYVGWLDAISLLFMLTGLVLLQGGWSMLRWSWPSIAFLFFMIPLPYKVENALGSPLQSVATVASTYALETFGLPAIAEGFTITMDEVRIGVVEACNGLGMLVMFFAYASAAVLIIKRPWIDKVVIMLSAIPIALIANIARITLTGLLHTMVSGDVANHFYHDFAGWLMMPMALAMFWFELKILDWMFIEMEPVSAEPTFSLGGGVTMKAKVVDPPRRDNPGR